MKILVYGINFFPEITSTGKYTFEMAEWLSLKGNSVRVVCGHPYYPAWKIFDGYKGWSYKSERIGGVSVIRCPMWVPRRPSGIKRLIHLFSFALSSIPALFLNLRWRPDVVWVVEPPFMCAPAAALFAKTSGAVSWIHVQDYEVDAAFEMGLIRGRRLKKMVFSAERLILSWFDRLSTISGSMVDLALKKGVHHEKIVFFRNWVDVGQITPLARPSVYRAALSIPDHKIVALYSGNMGGKQGLEILAEAAKALQYRDDIVFVFCGDGAGRTALEEACAGAKNVIFMGLQPSNKLSELLGLADIHLLPQRADAADLVMPSKLTGMLASGRPVVATAVSDTELGRVVAEDATCGLLCKPEDVSSIVEAVLRLAADSKLRSRLGSNGRAYAERVLGKEAILGDFLTNLDKCIATRSG